MIAKNPTTSKNVADLDGISDALTRAQALAHVLADAAGGDLGVEAGNVHHVSLMIAKEIRQAQGLLDKGGA